MLLRSKVASRTSKRTPHAVENLLDLTHEPHLHPTSLGNHAVFESAPDQFVEDDQVRVERWMLNKIPSPFWAKLVKTATGYDGPCDRWQKIFFRPPSSIYLAVGAGIPDGLAQKGDMTNSAWLTNNHFITPETEKSVLILVDRQQLHQLRCSKKPPTTHKQRSSPKTGLRSKAARR